VDDQLGAADEVEERAGGIGEARLVGEELARQPCTFSAPSSTSRCG